MVPTRHGSRYGQGITADWQMHMPAVHARVAHATAAQVQRGAILIPAGVYRITKTLDTRKSVVLRGAGKGLTTLFFPKSLTQVYGNSWSEVGCKCS